jgi:hypothetical protein
MTSKHSDDPTLDIDGLINFDALKAQVKKKDHWRSLDKKATCKSKSTLFRAKTPAVMRT